MSDRYVVIGNPVAHSRSPLIHASFAAQTGQDLDYGTLLAPLDGFATAVREFAATGGCGANVTVPFKEQAHTLATRLSERAQAAGAANTLSFTADGVLADNTDGAGLVRDLQHNYGIVLGGKRILLLGAGGASRGVLLPLLRTHPAQLCVANRTSSRAAELLHHFAHVAGRTHMSGGGFDDVQGCFDLVINATSASLSDQTPALPSGCYASDSLAYDMMYGKGATAFLRQARSLGAHRLADGAGMLVEQAAESFFIWRGVRPDTASVLAQLRAVLPPLDT